MAVTLPYSLILYAMDFKMHRDGKGANPREHIANSVTGVSAANKEAT